MNENLVYLTGELGEVGVTLSTGALLLKMPPVALKLVYGSFHSDLDTATATVAIQDDGSDIVAAIDAATAATTPIQWISKHFGGTNGEVLVAGGSELEIDVVNFAVDQRLQYLLCFLTGGN